MSSGDILLITGGTGSFGNAVLDRMLRSDLDEIRIFSRDEKKQDEMRHKYRNSKLRFYIGDIRDYDSIRFAMQGVTHTFCAAALKQVPSCEFYPLEAVRTNVVGVDNTIRAAIDCGVSNVVVLSTDKAVYPVNAMGMSKALMEKVAVAASRNQSTSDSTICVTRYGNVMASRGSVIPLFTQQMLAGNPITITDPEMTRFMMSLAEAVELVYHAFKHGTGGDTYVQKSPAATIQTLAEALQEILGTQVPVQVIGTRHGEKKHETLLSREELLRSEDDGDYFRVPADNRDLNYAQFFTEGKKDLAGATDYTSANTQQLDVAQMKARLLELPFIQDVLSQKA